MSKTLLLGASGTLGTELQKLNSEMLCPSHDELDVTDILSLRMFVLFHKPEIIINAAGKIDNRVIEKNPIDGIQTNIIGAANVAIVCAEFGMRLVFISTDYVYADGSHGNYKETDPLLPFNLYSWQKLGGECSSVAVKNHLIIRTSFGKSTFDYSQAFVDKWTSKDYVDKIAPLIYEAALSPITGVLNLGTERKTLYAHAKERNENVLPVKIEDTNYHTPYDTSLNLQKWINYKSSTSIAKPHTRCRICDSDKLTKYLDLGLMPLANNLEFTAVRAKEAERFPLQVMFCESCGLSQLSVVIDPHKMFDYYTYRSSVNQGYVNHCHEMAQQLKDIYKLHENSFHIDIAGNDGTLLKQFRDVIGHRVLNVDPATNLVAISEAQGIESVADFWSIDVAEKILESHGAADLITATNVFAHVHNTREFLLAAKKLLAPNGILVLEFPYLCEFIEKTEFDTIYFEHLSYVSVLPLLNLCEIVGMKIIHIEKQNIHGGSIRVVIANATSNYEADKTVADFSIKETTLGYDKSGKYSSWAASVKKVIDDFSSNILELKKSGYDIAAFSASAKGNTLLNCAGMNSDIIDYIVDQTPEKISKYSSGTGIKIVGIQELTKNPPDYLVLLAWNWADVIMEKARKAGYVGKFIIPIPNFTIID